MTVHVRARGENVEPPGLPLALPVEVQLVTSEGKCWTSTFSNSSENGGGSFKAKTD